MSTDSTGARPKKEGFVFVAYLDDFRTRPQISVRIMGKPVSVFRGKDRATFFAKEMACKHQGADLSALPVKNDEVVCRRHGWKYNVVDGRCVNHDSPPLRAHEVAVEEDAVFVSLFPQS
jgi:nitrite reductase/ring-hydroxylating ferredoxin subunit